MKLRKAFLIFGTLITTVVIFIIFSAKDLTKYSNKQASIAQDYQQNKWLHFEDRLKQLETNLNNHNDAVDQIKHAMHAILQPPKTQLASNQTYVPQPKQIATSFIFDPVCPFHINFLPKTNVQMLETYKTMKFDNIDGGVWKQGWRIEVDEKDWNRHNKLKVFVVPHSHNDPGWVKTFDEYFITQTKHILDNMVEKLPLDERRKFIWAEVSFFAIWWDGINEDARDIVRRLIRNRQLEIVTGGWVMNDEANSHWIAALYQLTEGHQWLQKNLNYTPQSSWAIDPFGMSLTQPVLLKEIGLENMLIQRVNYLVKKELASTRQLEFRWRQLWDDMGDTDMFTHLMPFYSYDVPHTCGPDPKICCQFDFKRLPGHGLTCPWKIAPQPITERNVAQKAELLLDQYRKKSKLYKSNVLLVPLGDDFRYDQPPEWDVQYENYQRLFDYMNSKLHLNVQAQFGTLSDYFNALHKEVKNADFPTLSGDFFTYSDRDDHYWSGYYTSRPFYKRMDRILLSYVRAAESIHTMAHLSGKPGSEWIVDPKVGLEGLLDKARKSLALFQHHDGITGTAKDYVMIDYAKKMLNAINHCQRVIQQCAHILLSGPDANKANTDVNYYNVDDVRHSYNALAERYQITIGMPEMRMKKIVIYNSLTFSRNEVVTFYVSTPFIEVLDFQNKRVKCQVAPIFEYASTMSQTKYQLSFVAIVPAFGLVGYTVNALYEDDLPPETWFSTIEIYNHFAEVQAPRGFKAVVSPSASEFTLQNGRVTASFSNLGLLKALKTNTAGTVPVHLDFAKYGVGPRHTERSGAYLFLPEGSATSLPIENTLVNVIQGPIFSSVTVQLPYIHHTATLFNSIGADSLGLEIENVVNISKTNNFELAMRLSTNINSSDNFFTDVNGYQMMRRKRFHKLPLQANYYPMPTMMYIEDDVMRLSLITSTPLGGSSLLSGQVEVMLDRRLNQDDNLGMGQAVLDNLPTRHVFRVVLEQRNAGCKSTAENHPAGFATLAAHMASQTLLNPALRLLRMDDEETVSRAMHTSLQSEFGVDFSFATLRTGVTVKGVHDRIGFVLQRQYVDVCFSDSILLKQFPLSQGTVNISALIPFDIYKDSNRKLHKASLSFNLIKGEVDFRSEFAMCPMEMQAFIL